MRCNKKQWISILLIAAMCFTMIPSVAFAETGTDEKTVLPKEEYVSVIYCEAPAVSLFALDSNGSVALKDGQYEQWIDRLDLTGNDYAEDFYSWMETTDAVITPESAEQLASGEYVHRVTSFSGTGSFAYTGEYEKDVAAIEEATREELDVHMMEAFAYIDAAFSAFSRDHAEVFWLNNTIKVMSECSYAYDSTGTVKYTQDIYFVLKSADFDIRAEEYRSAEKIKSVIEQRDAAVDEITAAATGSRYEKVAYFNEWLTTHNSYNSNVATAGRAAHECVSALSGSTGANGPVCEGYASAMKVLCDAADIPCVLVDGIADNMSGNPEGHMWNYVQMENGKWYAVDVTWNDPSTGSSAAVSGAEHTDYLLVGSNTMISPNGRTFEETRSIRNMVTRNGILFINGPVLSENAYVYNEQEEKPCTHEDTEIRDKVNVTASKAGYSGDMYCLLCGTLIEQGTIIPATGISPETIKTTPMYRLYNPNSGEHFYTGSVEERDMLASVGWNYEGIAWNAPTKTGDPVYRLFNPNNGDHHYTMSAEERDNLVTVGWKYEGVCWNSASADNVPQYRLYNPNADCGSHHYTGSIEERDFLVSLGWHFEGIGWFGIQ